LRADTQPCQPPRKIKYTAPIIAAEYGSLKVKGQYKMGKKIGLWQSFDENGNIINSEYYPD
jgi:antitoxin component YwqK of YwqJK toxin-antitoxin module